MTEKEGTSDTGGFLLSSCIFLHQFLRAIVMAYGSRYNETSRRKPAKDSEKIVKKLTIQEGEAC
jgi:hypothetical protein